MRYLLHVLGKPLRRRSDEELILMTPGCPDAFGVFYLRYADELLGFFVNQTRDPEVAADLTAEVFAAAVVAAKRYQRREYPARAWLYGIARHKLIDSRRRGRVVDEARRELAMDVLELEDDDLLRAIELEESAVAADEMLDALSPDERAAIRARVLEEREYDEIAAGLRCSEAVVRKRVSRGLKTLQRLMKESA